MPCNSSTKTLKKKSYGKNSSRTNIAKKVDGHCCLLEFDDNMLITLQYSYCEQLPTEKLKMHTNIGLNSEMLID